MRVFPYENARVYKSPRSKLVSKEARDRLSIENDLPFAPFEILGESIVPKQDNVPAVLQGIFLQFTNIDPVNPAPLLLIYAPTKPFDYGPTTDNVVLGANYIDDNLEIFDFTDDFKDDNSNFLFITVPPLKTYIVGVQYFIKPPMPTAAVTATPVAPEALGNRGYVLVLNSGDADVLTTATIRQNFIRSLSAPTDIISSTAYSVALSTGPVIKPLVGPRDLLS